MTHTSVSNRFLDESGGDDDGSGKGWLSRKVLSEIAGQLSSLPPCERGGAEPTSVTVVPTLRGFDSATGAAASWFCTCPGTCPVKTCRSPARGGRV